MKLVRYHNSPFYNPSVSHTILRDEMDRLFDVAFPALGNWQQEFPVDLYQQKDAFVVRAELPGFRKEDLSVEVANGVLTIAGHRKTEGTAETEKKSAQERKVSRSISLPENLQADKIQATYEAGILTIKLPKSEEVKPKQIAIEVK